MCWPSPVRSTTDQRGLDRHRGIQASHQVGERHAGFLRAATGQIIALAGDAHQTAHALNDEVITRFFSPWAGLAETGDRAVDQPWIERREGCIVEPVSGQRTGLVVFDQHVGAGGQGLHQLLAFSAGQVDGHR